MEKQYLYNIRYFNCLYVYYYFSVKRSIVRFNMYSLMLLVKYSLQKWTTSMGIYGRSALTSSPIFLCLLLRAALFQPKFYKHTSHLYFIKVSDIAIPIFYVLSGHNCKKWKNSTSIYLQLSVFLSVAKGWALCTRSLLGHWWTCWNASISKLFYNFTINE